MVQPKEYDNNTLMQRREPPREPDESHAGRLPYPGEVIGHGAPPYEIIGLDALSPVLSKVDFPATKDALIQQLGEARIPVDQQRLISIRELLDKTTPETFASSREVETAIRRIWQQVVPHPDRGGRQVQNDNTSARRPS